MRVVSKYQEVINMLFRIVPSFLEIPDQAKNKAFMIYSDWNDWFEYRTAYYLVVFDDEGERYEPGDVKIGRRGIEQYPKFGEYWWPSLEYNTEFDELPSDYFSLGQNENYYETINSLPYEMSTKILVGLKDCASNMDLYHDALSERVMQKSLMRHVPQDFFENRLSKLAQGKVVCSNYHFEYKYLGEHDLSFEVISGANPPMNIQVLIGRNGVGKSRCLREMVREFVKGQNNFVRSSSGETGVFSGIVYVSFSPFDYLDIASLSDSRTRFNYVGLGKVGNSGEIERGSVKNIAELADEFYKSFKVCRYGFRAERLKKIIDSICSEYSSANIDFDALFDCWNNRLGRDVSLFFSSLSSGYAILLLVAVKLVELVEEKTLVIFDEPEGHLHPPLLSAFIRSLSDLMIERNGVMIVATHSPVVLQEVPKSCVWVLRRSGSSLRVIRPNFETFGESLTTLTREVFGLEVTNSGFYKILSEIVENNDWNYNEVVENFGGQLGAEAKALVRVMISRKQLRVAQ